MCGLAGEIRFDGRPPMSRRCDRIASRSTRGPDGCGIWAGARSRSATAGCRSSTCRAAGAQPMVDAALGLAVVFNGCIYNYQQLREELEGTGYSFFSTSDTEVIAKAYAPVGPHCVDHFFGMFAFAIVEQDTGRLILGRDRLGIKPLYLDADRRPAAVRLHAARAAGRGRRRHLDRPNGAGPLHDLPRGGAGAADHPDRGPQAAARDGPGGRA